MINPPDDLLADLQTALPPEMERSSKHHPVANGGMGAATAYDKIEDGTAHMYESADQDQGGIAGYELPRESSPGPEVSEGGVRGGGRGRGERRWEREG